MSERVERSEIARRTRLWIAGYHFIDRIYFGAVLAVDVGNNLIFVPLLRKINGVGHSRKQVHDRRASHSKCISRNRRDRRRHVLEMDQNIEMAAKLSLDRLIDPEHIKEQEFIRKREIFGE